VRYGILGPLQVVVGGQPDAPTAPKVRALLAALLVRADHVVSVDELVAELWGDVPPRRATAALHVYVSQLRRFLAEHGRSPVRTCAPGYVLELGEDGSDARVLELLLHRGRADLRAQRHAAAAEAFGAGLALFRGPIDRTEGAIAGRFASWARETRLECAEQLVVCRFALGRHQETIGLLSELVVEFPLHEPLHEQLMLAYYRCGRRVEGLAAYRATRRRLSEELGLEPSASLRSLHQAMLVEDDRQRVS